MTTSELDGQYSEQYKPLITFDEAAEIARCPKNTIYDWSSRGLFDRFKIKPGRQCLLQRSEFIRFLTEDQAK